MHDLMVKDSFVFLQNSWKRKWIPSTLAAFAKGLIIFFFVVGGEESSTPKNEENEPLDMIC